MQETERDALSNSCMESASKYLNESKRLLKQGEYMQCIQEADACIQFGMKSVLALDDITFGDGVENRNEIMETFDSMYFETDALPPEWRKTIAELKQLMELITRNDDVVPQKEKAGRLISDIQFFLQELVDYLVQRNAIYWG